MPRRWPSVRSLRDKDVSKVNQDQFDFEFVTKPQELDHPSTPVKPKPTMFTTPHFRFKRVKNEISTPQATNASKFAVDKRLQLTKVEDSWIGVAFGSPTHPPVNMHSSSESEGGSPSKYSPRNEALFPPSPPALAKRKKFGALFKSRSSQMTISAPTNVYKIDGDQKIGMPIATKPWHTPTFPLEWVNSDDPEAFAVAATAASAATSIDVSVKSLDTTKIVNSDTDSTISMCSKSVRPFLPKLEIQIPSVEMDRYSVMFGDVSGIKPSNLLERRSKNIHNLQIGDKASAPLPPLPTEKPGQPRRSVTPSHRRKSSTYSLFPSPPKSRPRTSESSERSLPRRQLSFSSRPSIESSRMSPLSECIVPKPLASHPTPERKESQPSSSSPDETVASSERTFSPWRSTESLDSTPSSRTSIESEIFFDLKPARDANGREQSQYIFHKPDSPTIELAISKSRRARKNRPRQQVEQQTAYNTSPDLQEAEYMLKVEEKWRLSMELNQAIAEVERLTSPFHTLMQCSEISEFSQTIVPVTEPLPRPVPQQLLPSIKFRRRIDGSALVFPSPITERSEEFSPRPSSPLQQLKPQARQHIASLSVRPAPLTISNEFLVPMENMTLTPPPVPLKDAKFIPVSRFANTFDNPQPVRLIDRPLKRRKPKRSLTETSIITKYTSTTTCASASHSRSHESGSSPTRSNRTRTRPATISASTTSSATITRRPIPTSRAHAHPHPLQSSQVSLQQQQQQHISTLLLSPTSSSNINQNSEPTIAAISVPPTAEVSVARTISLERKQSHQILLSRTVSRSYTTTTTSSAPSLSSTAAGCETGRVTEVDMCLSPPMGRSLRSPTLIEGKKAHMHGASLDLVVERIGC